MQKLSAILEVLFVFGITLLLIVGVSLSPLGQWQRQWSNRPFLEYMVMILMPLLTITLTRRNFSDYGLVVRDLRYHLSIVSTLFFPFAMASAAIAWVNYRQWHGALILSIVQIALLFFSAALLRNPALAAQRTLLLGGIFLTVGFEPAGAARLGNALSALIFYILFLGVGEELLFRGYIQSRLQVAFGRRFRFFGVEWGWGIVVAAILFGAMHFLNAASLLDEHWQPEGWWGLWTGFSGLVYGFLREKSGSIVPPAILHGLPQAMAAALLGL